MADTERTNLLQIAEAHHEKIRRQAKGSAADALAAGRVLLAAKAAAPRKGWLAALKSTTSITPRSLQRYMVLARVADAGMLGENAGEMSFSEAYRLAVRQAVRLARKSTAATPASRAAAGGEQTQALRAFRQAARAAITAGVPFKKLERELAERVGAELLGADVIGGEPIAAEDESAGE